MWLVHLAKKAKLPFMGFEPLLLLYFQPKPNMYVHTNQINHIKIISDIINNYYKEK